MQPVSGFNWTKVSGGVGTTALTDRSSVVHALFIPGTYVGTLILHDAASITGTTATSAVVTLGIPATVLYQNVQLDAQFKKGIVYEATGTPLATIMWS